jgi:hypothetical protein
MNDDDYDCLAMIAELLAREEFSTLEEEEEEDFLRLLLVDDGPNHCHG